MAKDACTCLPDETIVVLYLDRNEDATGETARNYENLLFQVAHIILCDREDGRECVNDVYLAAWNSIPPTVPRVLRTCLLRIDRNKSLSRLILCAARGARGSP